MKKIFLTVVVTILFFTVAYQGMAYIPTVQQVLQRTVKLNINLSSLMMQLKTVIYDSRYDDGEIEISEQVYMKTDGSFRSERNFPYGKDIIVQNGAESLAMVRYEEDVSERKIDTVFPVLFFQKSVENLLNDLNLLGVDTNTVTFDRIDKKITFVIGNHDEETPGSQLWIDKKNGLPLRFIGITTSGGKRQVLRVEYMDYICVGKRFRLPARIEYYRNDELWTICTVEKTLTNIDLSQNLFQVSKETNFYPPLMNFPNVKE
jgi:outer membrane lipoprotein-sorting protein